VIGYPRPEDWDAGAGMEKLPVGGANKREYLLNMLKVVGFLRTPSGLELWYVLDCVSR
jgi:hypothetical protein